jgi:hypothetical protein
MYGLSETPNRTPDDYVLVPNVKALTNGLSLICALDDGRCFGLPLDCIGAQSEVWRPGDCGTLSVLKWFADEHQLPTTV